MSLNVFFTSNILSVTFVNTKWFLTFIRYDNSNHFYYCPCKLELMGEKSKKCG